MKKILFIAIALVAVQLTAQNKKEYPNGMRAEKMQRYQDYSPEEMANLQTKKMTLHLDLNESQQKEIKKLNLENAITRKSKMEAHKAQKESGNTEGPSKEAHLKMMNDRLDHQIAMKSSMKKILNADQFTEWEKSKEQIKNKQKRNQREKCCNK